MKSHLVVPAHVVSQGEATCKAALKYLIRRNTVPLTTSAGDTGNLSPEKTDLYS